MGSQVGLLHVKSGSPRLGNASESLVDRQHPLNARPIKLRITPPIALKYDAVGPQFEIVAIAQ